VFRAKLHAWIVPMERSSRLIGLRFLALWQNRGLIDRPLFAEMRLG
jgi:hypothetical protein